MATISNNESGLSVRIKLNDTIAAQEANTTKLASVETGAEVNRTASEIKTAYESNADTNDFTDSEKGKLSGIEALAQPRLVDIAYYATLDLTAGVSESVGFNSFDGTMVWTNPTTGEYLLTNGASEFSTTKTAVNIIGSVSCFATAAITTSTITITIRNTSGTLVDNLMSDLKVEIVNYK